MPTRHITLEGLPPFDIEVHAANDQYITADILENGVWEPIETEVIRRCLTADSDFYDIGANIGWYSVVAGLQLAPSGGTVHAFEPVRENVRLLTRNVMAAGLSNVRISPCALGAETGLIEMYLSPTNKGDHRAYACEADREIETGSITRFDRCFRPSARTPFVKIDTQGFEASVIEGMGEHLIDMPGLRMLIEFWPLGLNQDADNVSRLLGILQGAGFTPLTVKEGDPFVRPTSWDRLAAAAKSTLAPERGGFVNLLLHREAGVVEAALSDLMHPDPSHLVPAI